MKTTLAFVISVFLAIVLACLALLTLPLIIACVVVSYALHETMMVLDNTNTAGEKLIVSAILKITGAVNAAADAIRNHNGR